MANVPAPSPASPSAPGSVPSLKLPPSWVAILQDPIDHETGTPAPGLWSMPSVLPSRDDAIRTEAALRTFLQPADAQFVRMRIAMLKLVTAAPGTDGMSEPQIDAMLRAQIGEYLRLLADYPADIWAWACDEAPKRSKWFPKVAELEAMMRPRLEQRQRAHRRAKQILDAITNPRARVEHQPRTAEQRNAELRALKAQHGLDPDRPLVEQLFARPMPQEGEAV